MKYVISLFIAMLFVSTGTFAEKECALDSAGRAFVVTAMASGTHYLNWRLLTDDADDIAFDVIRVIDGKEEKITHEPITKTTDYLDDKRFAQSSDISYRLQIITDGRVIQSVQPSSVCAESDDGVACRTIEISSERAERVGFGDLDGDGNLDYVVKQPGGFGIDPYYKSWKPSIHPYYLEAYRHDGTLLWRYEMGWSIETGTWYSPVAVYDLDGDGCAEVAVKASDADHRNEDGHVWTGAEYIAILDGKTGGLITRSDWVPREPWLDAMGPEWGYEYASRHQIMIAYLDGKKPSVVIQRGTYDINILYAFDYIDKTLVKRWTWDNRAESSEYYAQSSHTIIPADIDNDGRDELVIGSVALDDDGTPMWSTNLGHVDACYVSDFDPERPGLEIFYGCEMHLEKNGACLVDALSGEILWGVDVPTKHVHSYGLAGDVSAETAGSEFYARDRETPGNAWYFDVKGNEISSPVFTGQIVHTVYWDADCQREILQDGFFNTHESGFGINYNGDLLATIDISGDWREEIITSCDGKLYIYSTTVPARDSRPALISDPVYRLNAIAFTSGYWHPLMLSYDMETSKGIK